jgi:hypothetical protein
MDGSGEDESAADAEWAEYESFLRRELPSSVRRELETRVDELLDSAEETLKSELPRIFRDLELRLFQDYQQRRKAQTNITSGPEIEQSNPLQSVCQEPSASVTPESSSCHHGAQSDDSVPAMPSYNYPLPWFDGILYDMPPDSTLFCGSVYGSTPAEHSTQLPFSAANSYIEEPEATNDELCSSLNWETPDDSTSYERQVF